MSNMSKCFSCAHKNDYDTKFGYYGYNLSGQECKGYSMFEPKAKPKPTNADRIRSMRDEELVKLLTCIDMFCCPVQGIDCLNEPSCEDCFARWLKQEAK